MRTFREPEFWIILASAAVLTAGHYTASTLDPFWHDLFRRLYYLPILLAGFRYGLRGGLLTAAAVSCAFLPHVFLTQHELHVQASEARFEIPLYLAVGIITGVLADRQRRADRALRRVERLKTLGEMAAGMAHEVRNPLAAIRSSAQMLAEGADTRSAELAGVVVSETDRVDRVLGDFLSYARPAPLQFARGRLSEVLDSCVQLLEPEASRRRIELTRHYPEEREPEVYFDPAQMRQAMFNLLLNAFQASPDGGRIAIRVEADGRRVRASVRDFGPGVPQDKLGRVFEPFFTTRASGTGLGLAIARRIVTEHGGRLRLENAEARGAVATVELPVGRSA
ncbi:MAG: ATP-binding protein [bacterium]